MNEKKNKEAKMLYGKDEQQQTNKNNNCNNNNNIKCSLTKRKNTLIIINVYVHI